jgi:hypothetical protein
MIISERPAADRVAVTNLHSNGYGDKQDERWRFADWLAGTQFSRV